MVAHGEILPRQRVKTLFLGEKSHMAGLSLKGTPLQKVVVD